MLSPDSLALLSEACYWFHCLASILPPHLSETFTKHLCTCLPVSPVPHEPGKECPGKAEGGGTVIGRYKHGQDGWMDSGDRCIP